MKGDQILNQSEDYSYIRWDCVKRRGSKAKSWKDFMCMAITSGDEREYTNVE